MSSDKKKKFYILIRTDLDVSVGKLMVHVGHLCSAMAWHYLRVYDQNLFGNFIEWYISSQQTKILLKVRDLKELRDYWSTARLVYGLETFEVEDAGFTKEVKKGTILMMGIEPITKQTSIDLGLDKLELYK